MTASTSTGSAARGATDVLRKPALLGGLGLAIVTPMADDGAPDLAALAALTHFCVAGGVDVLYPLGTTGEGALLCADERRAVLATVLEAAEGRPVIAGAGAISTADTVSQTQAARSAGAHGVLIVTPPYVKASVPGLVAHYRAVAEVGLPIVAYVVPGRTGGAVGLAGQQKILEIEGVVAVKEATANPVLFGQVAAVAESLGKLALVGDDALTLPAIALGGHGLISVVGQLIPRSLKALVVAAIAGRPREALSIHRRVIDLMEAMFWESNPLPVKQCLALRGQLRPVWRLPLCAPDPETTGKLVSLLRSLDLLEPPFAGDDPARALSHGESR